MLFSPVSAWHDNWRAHCSEVKWLNTSTWCQTHVGCVENGNWSHWVASSRRSKTKTVLWLSNHKVTWPKFFWGFKNMQITGKGEVPSERMYAGSDGYGFTWVSTGFVPVIKQESNLFLPYPLEMLFTWGYCVVSLLIFCFILWRFHFFIAMLVFATGRSTCRLEY